MARRDTSTCNTYRTHLLLQPTQPLLQGSLRALQVLLLRTEGGGFLLVDRNVGLECLDPLGHVLFGSNLPLELLHGRRCLGDVPFQAPNGVGLGLQLARLALCVCQQLALGVHFMGEAAQAGLQLLGGLRDVVVERHGRKHQRVPLRTCTICPRRRSQSAVTLPSLHFSAAMSSVSWAACCLSVRTSLPSAACCLCRVWFSVWMDATSSSTAATSGCCASRSASRAWICERCGDGCTVQSIVIRRTSCCSCCSSSSFSADMLSSSSCISA